MVRRFQLWPPATATVEEAGPALSHWTAAKPGATADLWPTSPQWLDRYMNEILNAHALSVFGDASIMARAARGLRRRLISR